MTVARWRRRTRRHRTTCTTSLASGSSCQVVVRFAPTAAGDASPPSSRWATATPRRARAPGSPSPAPAAAPAALSPLGRPTYDFGDQAEGTVLEHAFTLTNSGGLAATALAPTRSPSRSPSRAVATPAPRAPCADSLDPAGSCTVVVSFTAQVFGDHSGTLASGYQSGLGAQTASVALKARSHSPAVLSISDGPTYAFGNVVVGAVAEHAFEVTNAGGARGHARLRRGRSPPPSPSRAAPYPRRRRHLRRRAGPDRDLHGGRHLPPRPRAPASSGRPDAALRRRRGLADGHPPPDGQRLDGRGAELSTASTSARSTSAPASTTPSPSPTAARRPPPASSRSRWAAAFALQGTARYPGTGGDCGASIPRRPAAPWS
jgi:hypothetical protein